MSRGPLLLLWSAATVLLAGGTAWWVAGQREHSLPPAVASSSEKSPVDFHTWMHGHLDLTPGQHEKMEAAEVQFERERARLQAEIRTCGKALADAIRSGPPESPEVQGPLSLLLSIARRNSCAAAQSLSADCCIVSRIKIPFFKGFIHLLRFSLKLAVSLENVPLPCAVL